MSIRWKVSVEMIDEDENTHVFTESGKSRHQHDLKRDLACSLARSISSQPDNMPGAMELLSSILAYTNSGDVVSRALVEANELWTAERDFDECVFIAVDAGKLLMGLDVEDFQKSLRRLSLLNARLENTIRSTEDECPTSQP